MVQSPAERSLQAPSGTPTVIIPDGAPPLPSAPTTPRVTYPSHPAPKRKGTTIEEHDVHAKKARAERGYLDPFQKAPGGTLPPSRSLPMAPAARPPRDAPPIDPQLLQESAHYIISHAPRVNMSTATIEPRRTPPILPSSKSSVNLAPGTTLAEVYSPSVSAPKAVVPNSRTLSSATAPKAGIPLFAPPHPSRAPTRSPHPLSVPSAPVTVTAIPKAVRDKLCVLEEEIIALRTSHTACAPTKALASLQERVVALEDASRRDSHELGRLGVAQLALSATIAEQTRIIGELHQQQEEGVVRRTGMVGSVELKVAHTVVKAEPDQLDADKKSEKNDNLYLGAMRGTFLSALGVSTNTKNKDLSLPIVEEGGAWVVNMMHSEGDGRPSRVLRPDWSKPWGENTVWQDELTRFARAKVPQIQPLITTEMIAAKTDTELTLRMKTVFRGMQSCWKAKHASASGAPPARGPARDSEEQKTVNKRKQRKARKGAKRREALANPAQYDPVTTEAWRWIVDDAYASTDESGGEVEHDAIRAIDPGSDDEKNKPQVSNKAAPWTARPPTYRSAHMVSFLDVLDTEVARIAAAAASTPHARVRGSPKDVPLPRFITRESALRIPKWAVDPVWLAANPQDAVAMRQDGPSKSEDVEGLFEVENSTRNGDVEGEVGAGDDEYIEAEQSVEVYE
ncbi:hypothetical protein EV715DRAFT_260143 [Schizophyllum commune]